MPEISEIARIVHFVRKHLVGKTLAKVTAAEDNNVYGKVGTSAAEFEKAMNGKTIVGAGQQGKYFWMEMSSPPHPVMHFGMAGWLKIKSEDTYYYKTGEKESEKEWPPKYWKFILETKEEPKVDAAFVDFRRFARIRLVDCEASQLRKTTPLVENGPDPVVDKDIVTEEWLADKCHSKKVPIKAMLLDQAIISGIGNWVGDEIMYNAKMHPEQYANTLSDDQIKQLHKSIHYICGTACELLGDSEQFPEDWLFKHRWGKGKKDAPKTLPNGEKIVFLTVGGRTSAVIPSVQKKTGPVAKEMDEAESDEGGKKSKANAKAEPKATEKKDSKKRKVKVEEEDEDQEEVKSATKRTTAKKSKSQTNGVKEEVTANGTATTKPGGRGSKKVVQAEEKEPTKAKPQKVEEVQDGRRRSGRVSRS